MVQRHAAPGAPEPCGAAQVLRAAARDGSRDRATVPLALSDQRDGEEGMAALPLRSPRRRDTQRPLPRARADAGRSMRRIDCGSSGAQPQRTDVSWGALGLGRAWPDVISVLAPGAAPRPTPVMGLRGQRDPAKR